eukprot:CAMPEP_0181029080 /NCGR_PEP_ID=MMETSP1070-20121207/5007_1 /TAXON_ID=265543 /ORGANISM="Minutocellus polymorphus, Strain NH13" /LENGTH=1343 /DNA_ID=CAMNT_0023106365 /DNA_START=68 /DNA_END=4096 /DNA_ORIENTATION=-
MSDGKADHHNNDDEDSTMRWPEEPGSAPWPVLAYRRWMFSYMARILRKGSRKALGDGDGARLTQDDLYRVPASMDTARLDQEFQATYAQQNGQLLRTLWKLAAPTFVPAGFCQLLTVVAQVGIPLLVRELLIILEEKPYQNVAREGMVYVVLIFVASAVNALGTHRQRHLALKSGVVIRAAVVSAVYRRALNLTPGGRSGLTTGEVTNLVAVDAQKLFEVMQEGHLIWSCPLSMVLVSILLILIMGPTTLVGVAVLFAFVPMTTHITAKMIAVRKKRVEVSDERIEVINGMLQGIKVTKLNNYEARYMERIREIRERELTFLRKELYIWGLTLSITVITPVLASAVTYVTYVLVDENNILTASTTFTTLLLFSALRFPINYAGRLIGKAAQAFESARRISKFMQRESIESSHSGTGTQNGGTPLVESARPILEVKNGKFRVGGVRIKGPTNIWENLDPGSCLGGFALVDMNFTVDRGSILAIAGPVGGGKSTLMNALIGEVSSSPDSIVTHQGRVAYASQIPFVLNTTLRENILFGTQFDEARYNKVLDACCLRQDLEQLGAAGDMTEIGERGITLSGGQKQRVSIARVVYSRPDLAILDDPLSALDAGTSRRIFDQVLKSPDPDLLGSSAIVLVTHASHLLHRCEKIMVLTDGKAAFLGSWDELTLFESTDPTTENAIDVIRNAVQEKAEDGDNHGSDEEMDNDILMSSADVSCKGNDLGSPSKSGQDAESGKLIEAEQREHGLSSIKTWVLWFKHAGGLVYVFILILALGIDRTAYVATEWWLARWTLAADGPIDVFGRTFPAQTDGVAAQYEYLKVYATILLISFVAASQRSLWAVRGGARSARSLFYVMTERVLGAPLSYFETTPLGRVLNRFTYDIEILDHTLVENMSVLLIALSWFVAGVAVMGAILYWILLALVPVSGVYWLLQLHYRKSGTDLQRLDAVSRSPLQAMLAEGIDGAATIRVYEQEDKFIRRFQTSASTNTSAQLNFITAQRWLGVRIELLGAVVVFVSTLLIVMFNGTFAIDAGLVAMLIIWSSNFNITLGFLVDHVSEAEAAITSVERIRGMSELPQEKSMVTDEDLRPPQDWPAKGKLEFQDVALRYRPGLPLALNGLSFAIEPGQRCGVVGRTGAGKSSLTVALFRLVEIELGRILLDDVDLSKLGLSDVRGRSNGLSIIPQDPVLMKGTIRSVLDPFGSCPDEEIFEALACVRLAYGRGMEILDAPVDEGGANFSVGERQLLCMARAMLSKPKVLCLDEATASVDRQTDVFIQQMLRTRFEGTTLLTIAHRLDTIMDYDCILAMDSGKAAEFGPPHKLLENEDGVFSELVRNTGKESANALK